MGPFIVRRFCSDGDKAVMRSIGSSSHFPGGDHLSCPGEVSFGVSLAVIDLVQLEATIGTLMQHRYYSLVSLQMMF